MENRVLPAGGNLQIELLVKLRKGAGNVESMGLQGDIGGET